MTRNLRNIKYEASFVAHTSGLAMKQNHKWILACTQLLGNLETNSDFYFYICMMGCPEPLAFETEQTVNKKELSIKECVESTGHCSLENFANEDSNKLMTLCRI